MDTFVFLKFLAALSSPPAPIAIGVVLALLLVLLRRRRLAAFVLGLAIAHTLVLSLPVVGDALLRTLEDKARVAERQAAPCCYDAIVVLGGAITIPVPPERLQPELTDESNRVWQAARLYRRGVAPRIIVSGGSYLAQQGGPPVTEAQAMRAFLIELGVPADAITEEGQALNTIQNILNVSAIVGQGRIALVTSAYHMPRALQLAARARLEAAAFPTGYRTSSAGRSVWEGWMPSVEGLALSTRALKEIVALNLDFRRASLDP
jgi:uncharacterized protein (TIGR03382 family)